MPLRFPGQTGSTERFDLLPEAYDGAGRVVVVTSREAIDDRGIEAAQKASEKCDVGRVDEAGRE